MIEIRQGLVLLLLCLISLNTHGWGATGHKIACGIAYQLLETQQQKALDQIVVNYRTPDRRSFRFFSQTCVLADIARSKARLGATKWKKFRRFENWHFLNVPRSVKQPGRKYCRGNCILTGIDYHQTKFKSSTSGADKAEALFFLGHWVADAHQPMHISFADDRGGNRIKVSAKLNMHSLWDSVVVDKLVGSAKWWIFAEQLAKQISTQQRKKWEQSSPLEWTAESFAITISPETKYCTVRSTFFSTKCQPLANPKITEDDIQKFSVVAKERLQQSGVRLAQILRQLL
jgi:hypothetical protein